MPKVVLIPSLSLLLRRSLLLDLRFGLLDLRRLSLSLDLLRSGLSLPAGAPSSLTATSSSLLLRVEPSPPPTSKAKQQLHIILI